MSTKQAVFILNGEEYGLDITDVNTIEKDLIVNKLANSPHNVKGKVNLRGKDIPVYSLRSKFGLEDKSQDKNTRFLIIDTDGINIALEVDQVKGILDIEALVVYDVSPVIVSKNTSYIKSIANASDGLILLLDKDSLIDKEEIKALKPKN